MVVRGAEGLALNPRLPGCKACVLTILDRAPNQSEHLERTLNCPFFCIFVYANLHLKFVAVLAKTSR